MKLALTLMTLGLSLLSASAFAANTITLRGTVTFGTLTTNWGHEYTNTLENKDGTLARVVKEVRGNACGAKAVQRHGQAFKIALKPNYVGRGVIGVLIEEVEVIDAKGRTVAFQDGLRCWIR